MSVKRGKLEFHNVVCMKTKGAHEQWQEKLQEFRAFLVKNDIFITGPVIVRWEHLEENKEKADLYIYLPTYQKLKIEKNNIFSFHENFLIEEGLKIRHMDMDDDIAASEALLQVVAKKAGLVLKKPYYYIYLPVFQEYIIDIFAPIQKGEGK